MKDFYIYALQDPIDKELFYVGKTIASLKVRLANHEYKARSGRGTTPVSARIREIQNRNAKPAILLLEKGSKDWQKRERYWIDLLTKNGFKLLNINKGGNGAHSRSPLKEEFVYLLGKMPDSKIAKISGFSRENISYHRRNLKIKRVPQPKPEKGKGFQLGRTAPNKKEVPKEIIENLGKASDRSLAKRCNISKTTLAKLRKNMNIPSCKGPKNRY